MQIPIISNTGATKPWSSIPRINWAHPLAQGLVVYGYDAGGILIDLVNGGRGKTITATAVTRGVSLFGSGYKYATGGGATRLPFTSEINSVVPPVSIASSFFITGGLAAQGSIFGLADTSGNTPLYLAADSATSLRWGFNNGVSDLQAFPPSILNARHTMVGVGASTASTAAYLDGVLQTTGAGDPTSVFPTAAPVFDTFDLDTLAGNTVTGFIFYGALWKRALSAAEANLIHLAPWCFLIYPEDEMFATLVGVTTVTTSEDRFHQPWSSVGRRYAIIAAG